MFGLMPRLGYFESGPAKQLKKNEESIAYL